MKKHYLKKGVIAGVIFLLILVSIPMISGKEIIYPREEGPYNIIIKGRSNGFSSRFITFFSPFPLRFQLYLGWIYYSFEEKSGFFVNGEKQDIEFPADFEITSFKGLGPTLYNMILKDYLFDMFWAITGLDLYIPSLVIGKCAEIRVFDES